ncbi:MAG: YfhO family protein [Deltaproteobacteria bacterium]|nr:YfhO family protein [Deltaproteobacteria bacterium]
MLAKIFQRLVRLSFLKSPFFYALLPSCLFYIDILKGQWVPIHDTFQVTNIAYFVFNEFVQNNVIPLWYPYINYGVDNNWFLAITVGPSLALLLPIAKLFSHINFLSFYYASLFLDEIILLVGGYLLARFLFKSSFTLVFVCIGLASSTLWYAQVWYNFHFYYFFPLSLYLTLKGCSENSFWRLILGASLSILSSFGNLPYLILMQVLTLVVFLATAWWSYGLNWTSAWRKVSWREVSVTVLGIVGAGTYILLLVYGVEHVNYNPGREHGNVVDLRGFLTYGGNIGFRKFSELFTGTSWSLDINVYSGVLVLSLGLFGLLWRPSRRQLPFLITAVFLTLLSLGRASFIAPLVYYIPGMSYYRHIGLVLPLIKVMLIFLAGFGFDALVRQVNGADTPQLDRTKSVARINMLLIGIMLFACGSVTAVHLTTVKRNESKVFSVEPQRGVDVNIYADRWRYGSKITFISVIYAGAIIIFAILAINGGARGMVVVFALLGLHFIDVYSYRTSHFHDHMVRVDSEYWNLFRFRPSEFVTHRLQNYFDDSKFAKISSYLSPSFGDSVNRQWFDNCVKSDGRKECWFPEGLEYGTFYITVEPFLGIDPCRSIFRSDYWLPGIDKLYRAKMGMPIDKPNIMPEGYETREIIFPRKDAAFNKIIGCEFPKLQLLREIDIAASEEDLANSIFRTDSGEDVLRTTREDYDSFRLAFSNHMKKISGTPNSDKLRANRNETSLLLDAPNIDLGNKLEVEKFTANSVTVHVTAAKDQKNHWLYFSDAWHPFWRAYVNEDEVPILKANFGFKAVEIPSGNSVVRFVYSSSLLMVTIVIAWLVLSVIMLLVLWQAWQLTFKPTDAEKRG